jgi:hypothetical protein
MRFGKPKGSPMDGPLSIGAVLRQSYGSVQPLTTPLIPPHRKHPNDRCYRTRPDLAAWERRGRFLRAPRARARKAMAPLARQMPRRGQRQRDQGQGSRVTGRCSSGAWGSLLCRAQIKNSAQVAELSGFKRLRCAYYRCEIPPVSSLGQARKSGVPRHPAGLRLRSP